MGDPVTNSADPGGQPPRQGSAAEVLHPSAEQQTAPARLDIAEVIDQHYRAVYGYAFRLCGAECDALDLTQQTFLTAHRKLHQVRDPQRLVGWLFTVLRNCYLKTRQKNTPLPAASLELNVEEIPQSPPQADDIDQEQLQQALGQLSDNFKLVVVMFYYEGCSYQEIAERLEIPIGTVMSRLARAKGRLRHLLLDKKEQTAAETAHFSHHTAKPPASADSAGTT